MGVEDVADYTATLDAMAVTAASTFYEFAAKFGVLRRPKINIRKSKNWANFMKIARMCLATKMPVETFVEKAFMRTLERHSLVTISDIAAYTPKQLAGQQESSDEKNPQDLWNLLSCKLLDMVFAGVGANAIDILDNSMYGFPAWFRVFSPDEPCGDIIVHWGDLAYEEISSNPKLHEYVKAKRGETYNLLKAVISKI